MPEQQEDTPVQTQEVSIDSQQVPFADYVKARGEGKTTTAIPAESAPQEAAQEQEASDAPAAGAKPGTESETEPSSGKERSRGGGFQRRIDKLTSRTRELEAELQRYRTAAPAPQPAAQEQPKPQADSEPQRNQFQSDAEFLDAKVGWRVRQELAAERQRDAARQQQEREHEIQESHLERVNEAVGRHDDFYEVVENSKIVVQPRAADYIKRLDNGPEVMYHLAKNPKDAEALQALEEIEQVGALGQLAAQLRSGGEARPARKKLESQAPDPISPVAGASKSQPVPLDQMPWADYVKARRAGQKR